MNKRVRHAFTMHQRIGTKRFLKEVLYDGIAKRIHSKSGYIKNRELYEQHCLFVAGLPKSGSTWVSDLLKSLPGFSQFSPASWNQKYHVGEIGSSEHELYEGWDDSFKGYLAVVKGHTWGTAKNVAHLKESALRYVLTVRDPRDVIISEYWFVKRTPHHASHKLANRVDLSEYITIKLSDGSFGRMTLDWIRMWMENRDTNASTIVKYEELLKDPHQRLSEIADFLGLKITEEEIAKIIDLNSFERKTARKRGIEDTKTFLRKGTSGQWKEVFTEEQRELFSSVGEDVIEALDYEPTLEPK